MLIKLSSKGQLVIPKAIRQELQLAPDALFHVHVTGEGKIVLDPVQATALAALWGKYDDADFLAALEAEHQQELEDDPPLRA